MPPSPDSPPPAAAPRFDADVPANGYRWWYVDGISADGRHGIVVIAFVGSVFSPYYFAARARGPADPREFCAINVGLYRRPGKRWALTERDARALFRTPRRFRVGPSHLAWEDGTLTIEIDERSAPLRRPLKGRVVLRPAYLNERRFELDRAGRHLWRPIAPDGLIRVDFERPAWHWTGTGYFDTNGGSRALEEDFASWHWSRHHRGHSTLINYAVTERDGFERALALEFAGDGTLLERPPPGEVRLPPTGWRIARPALSPTPLRVLRTLEDTPFYARSVLGEARDGAGPIMHESLCLRRFEQAWVRRLLPFRLRRVRT